MMGILVAAGAAHVFPAEWKELVCPPRGTRLVTLVAAYGNMCSRKRVSRLAVHGNSVSREMKVLNGVAVLAAVLVWCGSKLPIVLVLMAIEAGRELHLIYCVFPSGQMALFAFDGNMFAFQRVLGGVVLFYAES